MKTYEAPLVRKNPEVDYAQGVQYSCHYEIFDKDNKSLSLTQFGACHANILHNKHLLDKETYVLCYVFIKYSQYSLEDIRRYIKFLRTIGFKISYKGIQEKEFKDIYVKTQLDAGEVYVFRFNRENYVNRLQLFAAITAFRYIFYKYGNHFTDIPERTFELKKIYGRNIQNLQAIILAYYTLGASETNHAFIGDDYNIYLPKLKLFNTKVEKYNSINSTIETAKCLGSNTQELRMLYRNKNYKELAEIIKIKYKE